jgi:chromosome segregation ATPase
MTQRDEYVQKMKSQLDALNVTVNEVEAKAGEARQAVRAKYRDEMASLRHQSQVAAAKLEELKSAGEDRWEAMVAEMDKLRDAFVRSFHDFKSRI